MSPAIVHSPEEMPTVSCDAEEDPYGGSTDEEGEDETLTHTRTTHTHIYMHAHIHAHTHMHNHIIYTCTHAYID